MLQVRDHVIFVDAYRVRHDALVTAVHGTPTEAYPHPCINITWISTDENRKDQYGRQIERMTSVVHHSLNSAKGICYAMPGEIIDAPSVSQT